LTVQKNSKKNDIFTQKNLLPRMPQPVAQPDRITLRGLRAVSLARGLAQRYATNSEVTMSEIKKIQCPHCQKMVKFERNSSGKMVGTVVGGGVGYALASGLGIAGGILGAPVAIPAALIGLGVGALLGNRAGKAVDNSSVECPSCGKSMSI